VRVVVVRPRFDVVTEYTYCWMQSTVEHAVRSGYEVVDLAGPAATWENLLREVSAGDVRAVLIATHGREDSVAGDVEAPLVAACRNDGCLAGRAVYYGACLAGSRLARSTRQKGAQVVAGYASDFVFHIDPGSDPGSDKRAKPFGDVFVAPALAILDGEGSDGIFRRTMEAYDKAYSEIARSSDPEAAMMLADLDADKRAFVVYGETVLRESGPSPLVLAGLAALALLLLR